MNANVVEAIRKSAAVPSMPQVVTRFLEVIQDPNFDYNSVVKVLSVDAGTVSEILRLSNSALFGVSRKVTSLKQALTLLGPRRTRSLVLGRYLVEAMGDSSGGKLDTSYYWRRSLACGVIGARIADKVCPRLRDEVFLAGLLADIGVAILSQAMSEEYDSIVTQYAPHGGTFTEEDEVKLVGASHGEVTAMVLSEWGLPEAMCDAVKHSHTESIDVTDNASQMARVVNASDRIAKLLCEIPDVNTCVETCSAAVAFAGVELSALVEIIGGVEADVEELATVLKIDVIPSAVYQKIAQAIRDQLSVAAGA
ncbi:MAG: HDOD domain-containing protein [Planctomycetes bacterium]|nr:HDOD domain-containing protein [Planctomycetota bacterium]